MSAVRKQNTRVQKIPEVSKEFVVEKILARRMRKRKVQYYLKWKGFEETENSWESEENLNCKGLIRNFEENRAKERSKLNSNTDPKRSLSLRTRKTLSTETVEAAKSPLEETKSDETDKENAEEIETNLIKSSNAKVEEQQVKLNKTKEEESAKNEKAVIPDTRITSSETELNKEVTQTSEVPAEPVEKSKSYEIINDKLFVTDFLTRPCVQNGFEKGLEVDKILGATKANGCLYLVVKFQGDDEPHMIKSEEANEKIPQMVIKFYEGCLSWDSDDEEE
ncbi:chromobox protein homolog 3-like [Calliphora vicina]|uniref:chromobox protein homolog 3-like n=1 Tax=Calliphora vicina TaxID=7373 RepID=UPI00325BA8B5